MIPQQLHHNIKKGPWHYYCGEKSKVVRTMNPDFPNVGCFFLTCRQNMPCRFFQWLGREWWDQIFQRRLQEVRKNGWKGKRKEKSSGLAEVDGPLDQKKARVGVNRSTSSVPCLPEEKLQAELEKYMTKQQWLAQKKKWKEHKELQQRWS